MKQLIAALLLLSSAFAVDTITPYAVDGSSQATRPTTIGRVFVKGEITHCPGISGITVQADIKNLWDDGSVKFAVLSFRPTTIATTGTALTIIDVPYSSGTSCNNETFLNKAGLAAALGAHDPKIAVTANGTTVTTSLATMLADAGLTFTYCKMEYFLQGTVVTAAKVQDCTSATSYDYGWTWNGASMTLPVTGNAATASQHPIFYIWAYASGAVRVDYINENMWTGRLQDQQYSLVLKDGASTLLSKSLFTHTANTRWRKTFWMGTAPGHIRIDHNFSYLTSTKVFPNYDPAFTVNPTVADPCFSGNPCPGYPAYAASDKGDIMGFGLLDKGLDNNTEGGQASEREPLLHYYSMGANCGTGDSACAKTFQMITGNSSMGDTSTCASIDSAVCGNELVGGGGMWNNTANIPNHARESRTTGNKFYCAAMASKNAVNAAGATTVCADASNGTGEQWGRPLSRYAFTNNGMNDSGGPLSGPGGTVFSRNGWSGLAAPHWQDYSWDAYLITGDPYYLEELQFATSQILSAINNDHAFYDSNYFFVFQNSVPGGSRTFGNGMKTLGHAALLSVDGSIEQTYYTSLFNSNLEVMEGVLGITGTTLTPTIADSTGFATDTTCASYDAAGSLNRWNFGRCGAFSLCANVAGDTTQDCRAASPHAITNTQFSYIPGECTAVLGTPISTNGFDAAHNTDFVQDWMLWNGLTAFGHLKEQGMGTVFDSVLQTGQKRLVAMGRDPGYNVYDLGLYLSPYKTGAVPSCAFLGTTTNAGYGTWAAALAGLIPSYSSVSSFATTSIMPSSCTNHGYPLMARSAAAYTTALSFACPTSGTCSGQALYDFLATTAGGAVPYNGNAAAVADYGVGCSASLTTAGAQVRYAIIARAGSLNPDTCAVTAPTAAQTISGTFNFQATNSPGQGNANNLAFVLDGSSLGGISGAGPYVQVVNTTGLTNGAHSVNCTCSDDAGGGGTCATINFTINNVGSPTRVVRHNLGGGRIVR